MPFFVARAPVRRGRFGSLRERAPAGVAPSGGIEGELLKRE